MLGEIEKAVSSLPQSVAIGQERKRKNTYVDATKVEELVALVARAVPCC